MLVLISYVWLEVCYALPVQPITVVSTPALAEVRHGLHSPPCELAVSQRFALPTMIRELAVSSLQMK